MGFSLDVRGFDIPIALLDEELDNLYKRSRCSIKFADMRNKFRYKRELYPNWADLARCVRLRIVRKIHGLQLRVVDALKSNYDPNRDPLLHIEPVGSAPFRLECGLLTLS